jgi:hypothetical protein
VTVRHLPRLTVLLPLTLAVAGCVGSSPSADPSPQTSQAVSLTTAPTSAPTSTTTAPATTPAPATTAAPPAGPGHCPAGQLALTVGARTSAMGQSSALLVLTNTGTTACILRGYPGVSLVDAAGASLGEAARDDGPGAAQVVTVAVEPGAHASARLMTTTEENYADCGPVRTSSAIFVIPPDEYTSLSAPFEHNRCASLAAPFRIGPVQPGDTAGS